MGVSNIGGPKIVGSGTDNVESLAFNSQTPPAQIQIHSDFNATANWNSEITYPAGKHGWLSLTPNGGKIARGETKNITVKVNTAGLQAGETYTATAYFRLNGASNIPVGRLEVKLTM